MGTFGGLQWSFAGINTPPARAFNLCPGSNGLLVQQAKYAPRETFFKARYLCVLPMRVDMVALACACPVRPDDSTTIYFQAFFPLVTLPSIGVWRICYMTTFLERSTALPKSSVTHDIKIVVEEGRLAQGRQSGRTA